MLAVEYALRAEWIAALGLLIPILTGVITKLDSSNTVKAVTALVLAAIVGFVSELVSALDASGGVLDSMELNDMLWATGLAFVANLASYLGIWKPIGETEYVPLQARTAEIGIGGGTPAGLED